MKVKNSFNKRMLSLLLAVMMLMTVMPLSVFADSITVKEQEAGEAVYSWNGTVLDPSDRPGGIAMLDTLKIRGNSTSYPIHEFNITGPDLNVWAYCSDFSTPPVVGVMYRRIPIESVGADAGSNYFANAATPQKLRNILMHSDLWMGIDTMRSWSGISSLTMGEAEAAVQAAIWHEVNGISPNGGAYSNDNVKAYYEKLIALGGVSADEMASIAVGQITKEIDSGAKTYSATVAVEIAGHGVDPSALGEITVEATYKSGNSTVAVPEENIEQSEGQVVISGIPLDSDLSIAFKATQANVNSVYLFEPASGRGASQTMISIVSDTVELETDVEVTRPGKLHGVEIFKDWKTESGTTVSNTAAKDYTSTFSFTYADAQDGFAGKKVIEDQTITGNGSYFTGAVFELNRLYKIEEVSAKAETEYDTTNIPAKYFKIIDDNGTVRWTDENGNTSANASSRFLNPITKETGSLTIKKVVTNAQDVNATSDSFTFLVEYAAAAGGDKAALANESYTLIEADGKTTAATTDSNGMLTLKDGESAEFDGLPVGYVVTVTEQSSDALSAKYTMDTAAKIETISAEAKTITVENTFKVGSLEITKSFAADSDLSWSDFTSGIGFKVTGPNGYSESFTLTESAPVKTLESLIPGEYTVTETNADKSGYALTVTGDGKVTVTEDEKATAEVKNSYRLMKGDLVIKKTLSGDASDAFTDREFSFTVTGTNYNKTYTLKGGEEKRISNLPAGTYTVTEVASSAQTTEANHSVTVNKKTGWSASVTIADGQDGEVAFVNTYTKLAGKLTVTKAVTGDRTTSNVGRGFEFTVTGPNGYSESFTLSSTNGWSKTLTGLTPGEYTVTEGDAEVADYTVATTGSGAAVTVENNKTATHKVTNNYTRDNGTLQLSKTVTGNENGYLDGKEFTFEIYSDSALSKKISGFSYNVNGGAVKTNKSSVVLKHGETANITLPTGTYYIKETGAAHEYFDVVTTGLSGATTVSKDKTTTKNVTNAYTRKTGKLTITKTFDASATWANFPDGILFTITGPADWVPNDTRLTYVSDGVYTFILKNSNDFLLTDLPAGVYSVTENVAAGTAFTADRPDYDRKTWVVLNKSTTKTEVTGNPTGKTESFMGENFIDFINEYTRKVGGIEIKKNAEFHKDTDEFTFKVTFTTSEDLSKVVTIPSTVKSSSWNKAGNELTFTIVYGTTKNVLISNVPLGTAYRVEEIAASAGYVLPQAAEGTVTEKKTFEVAILNKRVTDGTVSVSKTVAGETTDTKFSFSITVGGLAWAGKYTVNDGTEQTATGGKFTLGHGETATFTNIPRGAIVVIKETTQTNYSTTVTGAIETNGGSFVMPTDKANPSMEVSFTNTRKTGSLKVIKALSGDAKNLFTDTEFTFTLTGPSGAVADKAYTVQGVAGGTTDATGSFTLKGGQTATFSGLPTGSYTVSEGAFAAGEGISFTKPVDQTATVGTGGKTFTFTNTFNYKTGGLDVKKTVTGNVTGSFTFELYKADGTKVTDYTVSNATKNDDGSFTIENVSSSKTAKISNLKNGSYYVVERGAEKTDYAWTKSGDGSDNAVSVLESNTENPVITVTNNYVRDTGSLTISKTVDGDENGYLNGKDFTFTLYSDEAKKTQVGSAITIKAGESQTISDLPTGDYWLAESGHGDNRFTVSTEGLGKVTIEKDKTATAAVTNTYTRVSGNLTITKEMASGTLYPDGMSASNWSFDFTITGYPDDYTGVKTFTLTKENPSLELKGIPAGDYTIVETEIKETGLSHRITVSATDGKVSVGKADKIVTFTNEFRMVGAFLTVKKALDGISSDKVGSSEFRFELQKLEGENYSVYGDDLLVQAGGAVKLELPEGSYRIRETSIVEIANYTYGGVTYGLGTADEDGWIEFEIIDKTDIEVTATNEYVKDGGILKVTKQVDGYAGTGDTFSFSISGSGFGSNVGYDIYEDGSKLPDGGTAVNGAFTLKAGQTAVFKSLDPGATYTVTETDSGANYTLTAASASSFTCADAAGSGESGHAATGAALNGSAISETMGTKSEGRYPGLEFIFTNSRNTGSLTVNKVLLGNASADAFTMNIVFSDSKGVVDHTALGITGATVFTDRISVDVSSGSAVTISGIPAGLDYTVTEAPGSNSYDIVYDGQSGTINGSATCIVTNTIEYGSINVTKIVKGSDTSGLFPVTVTISPAPGMIFTTETATAVGGVLSGNSIVVKADLAHYQSLEIKQIPVGSTYTVVENISEDSPYTPMIIGADGVVNSNFGTTDKGHPEHDDVTIYNFYIPRGGLVVGKNVIATEGSPAYSAAFSFKLELKEAGEGGAYEQDVEEAKITAEALYGELENALTELEAQQNTLTEEYDQAAQEAYAAAQTALEEALAEVANIAQIACTETHDDHAAVPVYEACTAEGCEAGKISAEGEVDCTVCGATGSITIPAVEPSEENPEGTQEQIVECSACVEGKITGIVTTDCEACTGTGMIDTGTTAACDLCGGTNLIDDTAAIEAATAAAQQTFDADPAVIQKNALDDKNAEVAALKEKLEKLEEIIDMLYDGTYVEYDENCDITFDSSDENKNVDLSADEYKDIVTATDGNGNPVALNPVRDEETDEVLYYTFTLSHGQFLVIDGLPVGVNYKVTETANGGAISTTPEGDQSGTIEEGDTSGFAVTFTNEFAPEVGSITIRKEWVGSTGPSVDVTLYKNGEAIGTYTLSEGNWSVTIGNLELGCEYSVTEAVPSGYTVSYSNNNVTLVYANKDGETITVTNTRIYYPPVTNPPEETDPPTEITDPPVPEGTPTPTPESPEEPTPTPEEPIEIPDPSTPGGTKPGDPGTNIEDPDVPTSDSPKTGDSMATALTAIWIVMATSLLGVVTMLISWKRKSSRS